MARPPRLHAPGAIHHITLRGNHGTPIFDAPVDRDVFQRILAEVLEAYAARALAYCWMPNHVHLLLQVGAAPAGDSMRDLAGRYSRYLQGKRGTHGALFERRYFAQRVDSERYLVRAACYVHLNPVRAGLAGLPGEYPWSGHVALVTGVAPPWLDAARVLRSLSRDRAAAVAAYRRLTEAPEAVRLACPFPRRRRLPPRPAPVADVDALEQLIDATCRRHGLPRIALAGAGGPPEVKAARLELVASARRDNLASLREIGLRLGCCRTTLTRALSRAGAH